ncbi:MAG: DUF3141 domain-containing protein, partial [Ideonella sp.]|nr:DUF3141 domain-containing protein [Ideonella sp.]
MANIFDLFDLARQPVVPRHDGDAPGALKRSMRTIESELSASSDTTHILTTAASRHVQRISSVHSERAHDTYSKAEAMLERLRSAQASGKLLNDWVSYLRDSAERAVLSLDTLRKRGDIFLAHEDAGCPPVLVYDYEVVMDGKDQPYASNYMLLRILPPEGLVIDDTRRPYIIIDP